MSLTPPPSTPLDVPSPSKAEDKRELYTRKSIANLLSIMRQLQNQNRIRIEFEEMPVVSEAFKEVEAQLSAYVKAEQKEK